MRWSVFRRDGQPQACSSRSKHQGHNANLLYWMRTCSGSSTDTCTVYSITGPQIYICHAYLVLHTVVIVWKLLIIHFDPSQCNNNNNNNNNNSIYILKRVSLTAHLPIIKPTQNKNNKITWPQHPQPKKTKTKFRFIRHSAYKFKYLNGIFREINCIKD